MGNSSTSVLPNTHAGEQQELNKTNVTVVQDLNEMNEFDCRFFILNHERYFLLGWTVSEYRFKVL